MANKTLKMNEYLVTMKTNYAACLYHLCKYSEAVDVLRKLVAQLETDVYPTMQALKEQGKTAPDENVAGFRKKVSRLCLNYKLLANAMHLSGRCIESGSKQHTAVDVLKRAVKLCQTYADNQQLLASLKNCLETLSQAHEESVTNLKSGVFSSKQGKDLRSSGFRITARQEGMEQHAERANESKMSKMADSSSKSWKTPKEPIQVKSQTQLATQESKTPSIHSKGSRVQSQGLKNEFRVKTKTGSSASKQISQNTALKDIFSGLVQIKVEPNISIITGGKPMDGKIGPIRVQRVDAHDSSSKKYRIRDASDGKSEAGSSRVGRIREAVYSKQQGRHYKDPEISDSETYSVAPQSFSDSGYKRPKKMDAESKSKPLTTEATKVPPRKQSDSISNVKDLPISQPHYDSPGPSSKANLDSARKHADDFEKRNPHHHQLDESPLKANQPEADRTSEAMKPVSSKHVASELYSQEPGKKPLPIIPGLSPVQKPNSGTSQAGNSPSANYGISVGYSRDVSLNNTQNQSQHKDVLGSLKAVDSQQNQSRDISNSGADQLQDSINRSLQQTGAHAASKDKSASTVSQRDGTPKNRDRLLVTPNIIVPDDGIVHLKILRDVYQRKFVGISPMLRYRLLSLLEDYFEEDPERFSIFSPTIPDGDCEVTVRMMIIPKKIPPSSDSDYEVELLLFDPQNRSQVAKDFGGFTNKPIRTNLEYILNILDRLPYDWSLHWSSSLGTFPSLVQYLNSVIMPFLDIDKDPKTMEIFPDLVPTPGNIIPEIVTKFRDQDCFIGCYHVNDNNIRIVVNTMLKQGQAVQESRKLAMIDVELEADSFYDLIDLTSQMDEAAFEDYRRILATIKRSKESKFQNSATKFKDWLTNTIQTEDKDWLDFYLRQALEVKVENTEENSQALIDLMQKIVSGVGMFYDQPPRFKTPSGPAEVPQVSGSPPKVLATLSPTRWFFTRYIEEYDEYMLMSFQEVTDLSKNQCFFIDWAIISPENKEKPVKLNKEELIEVGRSRFNQDFGLDFRLLREDEKPFFFQAYSRILSVRKRDDEEGNYSVNMGIFRIESVRYSAQGEGYRLPLAYQLLSDGKLPIAVVVSTFNEFLVWKVGAVAAINPHSVCEVQQGNGQGPGSPEGEHSSLAFMKEMLQVIGWDVIQTEVKVEGGVPHFRKGQDKIIFESFDNLINLNRCRQLADELEPGWENTDSASSETN